jgi:hypothetical protein
MSVSLLFFCCDFRWLRLRVFFPSFSALSFFRDLRCEGYVTVGNVRSNNCPRVFSSDFFLSLFPCFVSSSCSLRFFLASDLLV